MGFYYPCGSAYRPSTCTYRAFEIEPCYEFKMFVRRRLATVWMYVLNYKFETANFVVSNFWPLPHFQLPSCTLPDPKCELRADFIHFKNVHNETNMKKKLNNGNRRRKNGKKNEVCYASSVCLSLSFLLSLANSYNLIKCLLNNFFEIDFHFLAFCTSCRLDWMQFMLTQSAQNIRETRGQIGMSMAWTEWNKKKTSKTESERWTPCLLDSKKISKLNYKILSAKLFGETNEILGPFFSDSILSIFCSCLSIHTYIDSWWQANDIICDATVVISLNTE